jgi:hypothetical protein
VGGQTRASTGALVRGLQAGLVAVIVAGGILVGVSPAAAHSGNLCTGMKTSGVGVLSLGAIRQLGSGHNHDIGWSFAGRADCAAAFPIFGDLRVRVRFIARSSSGGCTTTAIGDGGLVIFTAPQTKILATDVLPGTCYRLIWRPMDALTANTKLPGTLFTLQR